MRSFFRRAIPLASLSACVLTSAPARAQNWSFDARAIGMGGVGSTSNVAVDMVDEQRPYRPIVLPFGLFQIIPNLPKLDPTSDEFDLVRAIEYAASPIHFIIGRNDTKTTSEFITDLRNGTLNRDLNTYRGFDPATSVSAEGLASPNWGHTFKVHDSDDGSFQGIYVGAGPYFSMRAAAAIDPALAALFASPTPVYVPNTSFYMSSDTESQFAMAITGGYRTRIGWPGRGYSSGPRRITSRWKACTSARTTIICTDSATNTSSQRRDSIPTLKVSCSSMRARASPFPSCERRRPAGQASHSMPESRPSSTSGKWGLA